MKLLKTKSFSEYDLLDSGNARRLERFGKYVLNRPDPQAIWTPHLPPSEWEKADFIYTDRWQGKNVSSRWEVIYGDLRFFAKLTPFKHTGIFPEQAVNWEWMQKNIHNAKKNGQAEVKVLNLFGYTGIASLVCAGAGAHVTHVDASKPSIGWARENQEIAGLSDKPIRWILDDALKFCEREVRRGNSYDGILMDPPSYGHGPDGEKWDFFDHFPKLLSTTTTLLSEKPLFFLVNAYAISASSLMLENMLRDVMPKSGKLESGELCLEEKDTDRLLSTGIVSRWSLY